MRLILAPLLMALATPAWAEWVKYSQDADGASYYFDPVTVKKRGHVRRVWEIRDLRKRPRSAKMWSCTGRDGKSFVTNVEKDTIGAVCHRVGEAMPSSYRSLAEYDCKEDRLRVLSITTHSGSMAAGETLESQDGVSEWIDIAPGTIREILLKMLCK